MPKELQRTVSKLSENLKESVKHPSQDSKYSKFSPFGNIMDSAGKAIYDKVEALNELYPEGVRVDGRLQLGKEMTVRLNSKEEKVQLYETLLSFTNKSHSASESFVKISLQSTEEVEQLCDFILDAAPQKEKV